MDILMAELVAQSGFAARTIRQWIRLGLLPKPEGTGPAALYGREHLLRVWVIAARRREGIGLEAIKRELAKMSAREMARFEPTAQASDGDAAPLPPVEPAASDDVSLAHATELPGRRYTLVPLLPGMVLMVDEDAASVVRRAAMEIVERYGTRPA
jgi:DNA-binding transcriptional MerR regulator